MQQIFNHIKYLVGSQDILEQMEHVRVLPVFSNKVLDFFECLSKRLMADNKAKKYPDIVAYAFWIRRASLERTGNYYKTGEQKVGRGIAFQIAPSNIPIQFAVSMTYAFTAGNASVIRLSDTEFEQIDIICRVLQTVLDVEYPDIAPYICIIRYNHDNEITQVLSELCDIRMIWGGDHTIAAIRKTSIRARCIDLGFADRYSVAVINSDDYLSENTDVLAYDFYNDTYFSDQNACSSPRIVIWMGKRISEAKEVFWNALEDIVSRKYRMEPICGSEKLLKTAVCAAKHPGIKEIKKDNLIVRIELPELYNDIMDFKGSCGYFFEYSVDKLQDIVPIMKKGCQTIAYIGAIEGQIREIINVNGVKGVDRIVPIGHAADISWVWDGLDLPNILSRQIGRT